MKALSLDLRERILKAYEKGDTTRDQVARRFEVSLGMVKKLLARKKDGAEIGARYDRCGRKPKILESHRQRLRESLSRKPDMTLEELRKSLELDCTLPAIHYVLADMGLTYKKRLSMPASKADRTSLAGAQNGGGSRRRSIRHGLSSSMSRQQKQT